MNEIRPYPVAGNAHQTQHPQERLTPTADLMEVFPASTPRERPEVVALWCVGIGFVLGWKLKPW
jgi:hypothetical protein